MKRIKRFMEKLKRKLQIRKEETPREILVLNRIIVILIILLIVTCFVKAKHNNISERSTENITIVTLY